MAKKPAKKVVKSVAKKTIVSAKKGATKMAMTSAKKEAPKVTAKWNNALKPKNTGTLSYTQAEFVENIRGFLGLEKRTQAKLICDDFARFIKDSLKRGYKLPFLGLGKLYVRQSKARQGRNPATGETINIPAKKRVRFVATKALKEAVL